MALSRSNSLFLLPSRRRYQSAGALAAHSLYPGANRVSVPYRSLIWSRLLTQDLWRGPSVVAEKRAAAGGNFTCGAAQAPWSAIAPACPLTISTALKSVKTSSMIGINVRRGEAGELGQERFFDRALRTVREDHEKVEYLHLNPVRRGFVKNPEDWKRSSLREYAGVSGENPERFCGLRSDRVPLPFDVRTRIGRRKAADLEPHVRATCSRSQSVSCGVLLHARWSCLRSPEIGHFYPAKPAPPHPHPSHPTLLQQPNALRRKLPVHRFPIRND
jgi:hypothetical protein